MANDFAEFLSGVLAENPSGTVVDGDTYRQPDGSRVRMAGYDSPEIGTGHADLATERLRQHLPGTDVAVGGPDATGARSVGYATTADGRDLGTDMITSGMGVATKYSTGEQRAAETAWMMRRAGVMPELLSPEDAALAERREATLKERPFQFDITGGRATSMAERNAFGKGVVRGIDNTQGLLYHAMNALGELTGTDALAAWGEEGAFDNMLEAALNPAEIGTSDNIESLADLGTYVAEALGEQVPNLLITLTGAGAGAGIAKAAIGKALIGRLAGAATAGYPLGVGEVQQELKAGGVTAPGTALLGGVAVAGMDALGLEAMLGRYFGGGVPTWASKKLVAHIAKNALLGAGIASATEVPTEVAQELVVLAARAYHDPEFEIFSDENLKRLREAAYKAAAVGSTIGGTAGSAYALLNPDASDASPERRDDDDDDVSTRDVPAPGTEVQDDWQEVVDRAVEQSSVAAAEETVTPEQPSATAPKEAIAPQQSSAIYGPPRRSTLRLPSKGWTPPEAATDTVETGTPSPPQEERVVTGLRPALQRVQRAFPALESDTKPTTVDGKRMWGASLEKVDPAERPIVQALLDVFELGRHGQNTRHVTLADPMTGAGVRMNIPALMRLGRKLSPDRTGQGAFVNSLRESLSTGLAYVMAQGYKSPIPPTRDPLGLYPIPPGTPVFRNERTGDTITWRDIVEGQGKIKELSDKVQTLTDAMTASVIVRKGPDGRDVAAVVSRDDAVIATYPASKGQTKAQLEAEVRKKHHIPEGGPEWKAEVDSLRDLRKQLIEELEYYGITSDEWSAYADLDAPLKMFDEQYRGAGEIAEMGRLADLKEAESPVIHEDLPAPTTKEQQERKKAVREDAATPSVPVESLPPAPGKTKEAHVPERAEIGLDEALDEIAQDAKDTGEQLGRHIFAAFGETPDAQVSAHKDVGQPIAGFVDGLLKHLGIGTEVVITSYRGLKSAAIAAEKAGHLELRDSLLAVVDRPARTPGVIIYNDHLAKRFRFPVIVLDTSSLTTDADKLYVLAHELGHLVQRATFDMAPKKVQKAVREYLGEDNFSENFANELLKWVAKREAPRTLAEKFFSGLVMQLRKLWAYVRGRGTTAEHKTGPKSTHREKRPGFTLGDTEYKGVPILYGTGRKHPVHGGVAGASVRSTIKDGKRTLVSITLDKAELQRQFDVKHWTSPRTPGITPLLRDAFTTVEEYAAFVVEHEIKHAYYPHVPKGHKNYAATENDINRAAAAQLGLRVYPDSAPTQRLPATIMSAPDLPSAFDEFLDALVDARAARDTGTKPATALGRMMEVTSRKATEPTLPLRNDVRYENLTAAQLRGAATRALGPRATRFATSYAKSLKEVFTTFRPLYQTSDAYLRKIGSRVTTALANDWHAQAGAKGGRTIETIHQTAASISGHWMQDLTKVLDGLPADTAQIRDDLIMQRPRLTDPRGQEVRAYLTRLHTYLTGTLGMTVKLRQHYFPLVLDTLKMADNEQQIVSDLAATGMAAADAKAMVRSLIEDSGGGIVQTASGDYIDLAAPFFEFAKPRKLSPAHIAALRNYYVDDIHSVLTYYTRNAIRRAVIEQRYSVPVASHASLHKAYKDLGVNVASPMARLNYELRNALKNHEITSAEYERIMLKILPAYLGRLGSNIDPRLRQINSWGIFYQNIRLLIMSPLTSLADFGVVIWRNGSPVRTALEAFRIITNKAHRKDLYALAKSMGAIENDLMDHVLNDQMTSQFMAPNARKWNDRFFRANGLHALTQFGRVLSMSVGKQAIVQKVETNNTRWLTEIGLNIASAQRWIADGMPTDAVVAPHHLQAITALHQIIDESIIRPDATIRPAWASDPHFALLWHLKSFIWGFHSQVLRRAWGQMRDNHGISKAFPPIMLMAAVVPFAAAGYELRRILSGQGQSPKIRKPEDDEYFFEMVQRSGLLGIFQLYVDMDEAENRGRLSILSLMGPTVSQLEEALTEDLGYFAERAIPGWSQFRYWAD